MVKVDIFSDGSATTKDKPGGYAWVLLIDDKFYSESSGYLEKATNNDAELIGSLKGLDAALNFIISSSSFPLEYDVTLKSDSKLILGWASGIYAFKQAEKIGLYDELRRLMRKLKAKTEWVKGHSGDKWNERCDQLANQARLKLEKDKHKEEAKTSGKTLIGKKREGVICLWYSGKLKVLDFCTNIMEDYDREIHGKRGSLLEIREDKTR